MKRFIKKAIFLMIILCAYMAVQSGISGTLAEKAKGEPSYVGMEKCKECHPGDVKTYSEWKYSRNFRILEMRGKEHDPQCVPCHTTGYGQPGGFVSVEETPHMKNVQCEACHGPGEKYQAMMMGAEAEKGGEIANENARKSCGTCHNPHIPTVIHADLARKG